jgi:hypothetical protein
MELRPLTELPHLIARLHDRIVALEAESSRLYRSVEHHVDVSTKLFHLVEELRQRVTRLEQAYNESKGQHTQPANKACGVNESEVQS